MLKLIKTKKSTLLAKSIEQFITNYLEEKNLGKVKKFKINMKKRKISAILMLKREKEPLEIIIRNYNFIQKEEKGYFTFDSIRNSRDWESLALEKIIANDEKKIEVPEKYVNLIKIFL